MHFKMYKSGKNWMVAGLMTTAVLAGLTLSNTNNDVVAHAADNAPVAANKDAATTTDTQQTPADKAKADVDATSNKIASATNDVNDVKNNNKTNKDAKNANDAYSKAQDNVNKTSNDLNEANAVQKAAQQSYDENQNAITDADNDKNIKPAKDAADKAYNDAINDQNVKYIDAKNAADADKKASDKAYNDYTSAQNDYVNDPSEWNDEAQQSAKDAYDKASAKSAASTKAMNDLKDPYAKVVDSGIYDLVNDAHNHIWDNDANNTRFNNALNAAKKANLDDSIINGINNVLANIAKNRDHYSDQNVKAIHDSINSLYDIVNAKKSILDGMNNYDAYVAA